LAITVITFHKNVSKLFILFTHPLD